MIHETLEIGCSQQITSDAKALFNSETQGSCRISVGTMDSKHCSLVSSDTKSKQLYLPQTAHSPSIWLVLSKTIVYRRRWFLETGRRHGGRRGDNPYNFIKKSNTDMVGELKINFPKMKIAIYIWLQIKFSMTASLVRIYTLFTRCRSRESNIFQKWGSSAHLG